jgi:NADH-quinone oxidoreductase subunit N
VAFSSTRENAISAALFYTAAYAAMNVGAFLVLTAVSGYSEESRTLDDYTGLALRRPVLAALLGFFLISLIGIPFTGGFFGKFYAFSAAVGGGAIALAIIGLLNSGIAAAYYLRLAFAAAQPPADGEGAARVSLPQLGVAVGAALLFTTGSTLALGIVPNPVLRAAEMAAHTLRVPAGELPAAVNGPEPISQPQQPHP